MHKILIFTFIFLCISITSIIILRIDKPNSVIDVLENRYSNLEINNPGRKRKILLKISDLYKNDLIDFEKLDLLIKQMGDAHLLLSTNKNDNGVESGLYFHLGKKIYLYKNERDSSLSSPAELIAVDDIPIQQWLEAQKNFINFSTFWGRKFRTLQLLSSNFESNKIPRELLLKDFNGRIFRYEIAWKTKKNGECIKGKLVSENTFSIEVKNLWCQKNSDESSKQIFENFKNQLSEILLESQKYSNIIIDLRNNSGGGDDETKFILEQTLPHSAFLYKFKFLNSNLRFPKNFINRENSKWQKEVIEYISPDTKNPLYIGDKSIVVLINQGCFSSCEVLASVYKLGGKLKLVGKRTHGSAGYPTTWQIPDSNFSLTYPTLLLFQENGLLYEGVGVAPDMEVEISSENTVNNQDPYIHTALSELN